MFILQKSLQNPREVYGDGRPQLPGRVLRSHAAHQASA